jgi:hypothetical protein
MAVPAGYSGSTQSTAAVCSAHRPRSPSSVVAQPVMFEQIRIPAKAEGCGTAAGRRP